MNREEARLLLQACRSGEGDRDDPQMAEALREAERDPELARWFAEEQAFDRAIAAHLAEVPTPFGLKTRLLAQASPPAAFRFSRWVIGLAGVAALFFLFAQVIGFWRGPSSTGTGLTEYSADMVSFIKLPPALEQESNDLETIQTWLARNEALRPAVPPQLAELGPLGCRVLSFRAHKVSLVCFQRDGGRLAHLFVVDRAALPQLKPGQAVVFQRVGEWITASWAEKDRVYMIALQGNEQAVQPFLPRA
ncbi:hypothetical protein BH18VER2_BH18VER2_11180 [soil metagenome]